MSEPELVFKKPPAKEVHIGVQFRNSLQIADARAKFHHLVKERFPAAIMPEKEKLTYDFSDFSLFTENLAERLEISINYFRFVTTSYPGFALFQETFLNSLRTFVECYGLDSYTHFGLRYQNDLPLPEGQDFDDCFRLKVAMPPEVTFSSYAGRACFSSRSRRVLLL
ncbi:MAG: TIGR04255 family protein [Candidatus Acidiferrales bacterium]